MRAAAAVAGGGWGAAWLDVLAVDLLGYALIGDHSHLVLRTRPEVTGRWPVAEIRQRATAAAADGRPRPHAQAPAGRRWSAADLAAATARLIRAGTGTLPPRAEDQPPDGYPGPARPRGPRGA